MYSTTNNAEPKETLSGTCTFYRCLAKVNKQHYARTYIVRLHCKLRMHVTCDRRWRRNSHVFTQELWRLQKTWRCQGHASLHGCNHCPMQLKGALAEHGGTGGSILEPRKPWELIWYCVCNNQRYNSPHMRTTERLLMVQYGCRITEWWIRVCKIV